MDRASELDNEAKFIKNAFKERVPPEDSRKRTFSICSLFESGHLELAGGAKRGHPEPRRQPRDLSHGRERLSKERSFGPKWTGIFCAIQDDERTISSQASLPFDKFGG